MNPYTKLPTCPLVTKLDRMPKKGLKFRGKQILPHCRGFDDVAEMSSLWRSHQNPPNSEIFIICSAKRYLIMIDTSFLCFVTLFLEKYILKLPGVKNVLHFWSPRLMMTSEWRHVTSSCRLLGLKTFLSLILNNCPSFLAVCRQMHGIKKYTSRMCKNNPVLNTI